MKQSRYLHYIERDGFTYWYNALTHKYFRLPIKIGKKVFENLHLGTELKTYSPPLYEKLCSAGILIEDHIDELSLIRKKYLDMVESKNAFLVIVPTLNCNYSCWYCIQNHIPSMMSEETIEKVKKHIDYLIADQKITGLHIDWFGGEPFMYFKKVVVPISKYAIARCAEAGIPFDNSATTNAYFINEDVCAVLGDLRFGSFQITLDGDKEFHDKVKFKIGLESAFDHALININRMLKMHESISVALRINYTHENLTEAIVDQVADIIETSVRKRITIFCRKVWQKDVVKDFGSRLTPILDKFGKYGFNIEVWNPVRNFVPCYASQRIYKCINYNAALLKCTANDDLYAVRPKGELNSDGTEHWNLDMNTLYCKPGFENARCLQCNKLPSCMGLCARNRMSGSESCVYEDMAELSFEDSVVKYIDESIRHQDSVNGHK